MDSQILINAVTIVLIVIGWVVLGSQRVNEALLAERRVAYLRVLELIDPRTRDLVLSDTSVLSAPADSTGHDRADVPAATSANSSSRADDASVHNLQLVQAIHAAEMVASRRMRMSKVLDELLASDTRNAVSTEQREAFVTLARMESIYNARILLWWHRSWYTLSHDEVPHV